MKNEIYIDAKNLKRAFNLYYSNLFGQDINFSVNLIKGYEGYPETKVKKLELSYDIKKKINNIDTVITCTFDLNDIKLFIQSLIPECEIGAISIKSSCHDYYGEYEEFDGLTVEIKENILALINR